MLILTRKEDQAVWIGPDVRVLVVRTGRDRTKLGVMAPGLEVHREEVARARLARGETLGPPAEPAAAAAGLAEQAIELAHQLLLDGVDRGTARRVLDGLRRRLTRLRGAAPATEATPLTT